MRCGVVVGFLVVVVWEVVVCLKSRCAVRMKGDAVLASAVQVFEAVEGGFVVLMGWSMGVGCKKCENWGDVRAGACS